MEKHNKKKLLFVIFGMLVFIAVGYGVIAFSVYKTFYPIYQKGLVYEENSKQFAKQMALVGKYDKQENYKDELTAAKTALKYSASEIQKSQAYYAIGNSYFYLEDYNNAKINAQKSVKLDPKYTYAYDTLFKISMHDKNYDEALDYAKKFIEILPNSDIGYADAAYAYYSLGNKEEAVKNINKAIKLSPKEKVYKDYLKTYESKALPVAPAPTLNPRELDPNYWKTELGYMNDDKGKLDIITGDAKYNQDKIAKEKIWLAQRINIINAIYAKLSSGQKLNSSDLSALDNYWAITDQYYALADEILSGK